MEKGGGIPQGSQPRAFRPRKAEVDRGFPQISGFSTVWEKVFHGVENGSLFFPWRGKWGPEFSMAWKTGRCVFHGVENPEKR
jgi:hypothetical protein